MLSSILMTAALAAGVMAVPVEKRDLVTEYSTRMHYAVHTVTQTVTAVAAASPDAGQQKDVVDTNNNNANVVQSRVITVTSGSSQPSAVQNNFEVKRPQPAKTTAAPSPAKTTQPKESEESDAPGYGGAGGGTQSSSGEDPTFIKRVVNSHNVHRANHSVPLLSWSDDLWQSSKMVAETCVYEHKVDGVMGGGFGQNIAAGVVKGDITKVISDMFYNGEIVAYEANDASKDYTVNPNTDPEKGPTTFEVWGHFTQVVWKGTTEVACYVQDCTNRQGGLQNTGDRVSPFFTVCNYKTPGNSGDYKGNVLKPKGDPTADYKVSL